MIHGSKIVKESEHQEPSIELVGVQLGLDSLDNVLVPASRLSKMIEDIAATPKFTVILCIKSRSRGDVPSKITNFKSYDPTKEAVFPLTCPRVIEFVFVPCNLSVLTPDFIQRCQHLCPLSGEEKCFSNDLSNCLAFRLDTTFLHDSAVLPENLIIWIERHFSGARGIYYDNEPADAPEWPVLFHLKQNHEHVLQHVVSCFPLSLSASHGILRSLFSILPNKRFAVGKRVIASKPGSRDRLVSAIKMMPEQERALFLYKLNELATYVNALSPKEIVEINQPYGAPSRTEIILKNDLSKGLPFSISDDIRILANTCSGPASNSNLENLTLTLEKRMSIQGGLEHYVVHIAGTPDMSETETVSIYVLGGDMIETSFIFMRFTQPIPSNVMICRRLTRPSNPMVAIVSLVLVVGLGKLLAHPKQRDAIDSRLFKAVILRLRDFDEWTFEDFTNWLTQLAWVNKTLPEWKNKIAAIPKDDGFKGTFSSGDTSAITQWMSQWGFTDEDCIVIHENLLMHAGLRTAATAPKNTVTGSVENLVRESHSSLRDTKISMLLDARSQMDQHRNDFTDEYYGYVVCNLGLAYQGVGQFQSALQCFLDCLKFEHFPPERRGPIYCNLGIIYQILGNTTLALEYHLKHLKTCTEESHNRISEAKAYCNIGISYCEIGDIAKAIEYHKKHLQLCQTLPDYVGEGRAYANLGIASFKLGQIEKSKEYHYKHLHICQMTNNLREQASAFANLANVYEKTLDFTEAIKFHLKHLEMCKSNSTYDILGQYKAYANIARVYRSLGKNAEALQYSRDYLQLSLQIGDRFHQAEAHTSLANTLFGMHSYTEALAAINAAIALYESEDLRHVHHEQLLKCYDHQQLLLSKTKDARGDLKE
jgi:tetratricopeptide (TPR) repeat protein